MGRTKYDPVWLAGLFEKSGRIAVSSRDRKLYVRFRSVDRDLIARVIKVAEANGVVRYGGKGRFARGQKGRPIPMHREPVLSRDRFHDAHSKQTLWEVSYYGHTASDFLRLIEPHLHPVRRERIRQLRKVAK